MRIAYLIGVCWVAGLALLFFAVAPVTIPLFFCSIAAAVAGFRGCNR
jgi:hypothetical protein